MRRSIVFFSALVIALVSIGASQKDSKTTKAVESPATVAEVQPQAPNLAPSLSPEVTVTLPDAQAPATSRSQAAAYQLNWYSVNGGGATNASSTNYQMGLSVGQSVAGAATGASYDVGIGFWYGASAGGGCPIVLSGDVNLSSTVTSADIIVLVNFVFKGGATPLPCAANGDVNCSGSVTSSDIIVLVNFVFKGGAAPCNTCTSPLAAGC